MEPLSVSLRVAGIDTIGVDAIASTAFTFKGRLTLGPDELCLEWTGSAHVDEVAFTGIRSEQVVYVDRCRTLYSSCVRAIEHADVALIPHIPETPHSAAQIVIPQCCTFHAPI